MKIIEQSHEYIDRNMDALKLIEFCGRTCYKSEDKITDTSAEKFVAMLVKRGHWAMIEHATICFEIHHDTAIYLDRAENKFIELTINHSDGRYIASANLTAWAQYFARHSFGKRDEMNDIYRLLRGWYPIIFFKREISNVLADYFKAESFSEKALCRYGEYRHIYRTIKFITNRSVTHELVRHRPPSYAQESTRYVNYGSTEIQFIKPVWWDYDNCSQENIDAWSKWMVTASDMELPEYSFLYACNGSSTIYKDLMSLGWRPEQAREILPNSLKTEIVVTANLSEWKHIFNLRTANAAHPQIRALMIPVHDRFITEFPKYF